MTAILTPHSSPPPAPSTTPPSSISSNPNHPTLPPLITSTPRRTNLQRPPSNSRSRLSTYSTTSSLQNYSRPPSHVFPVFHSSLSYTSVRDFAYPALHPLHYGPPPDPLLAPSSLSTPASEQRRLSDPPRASWEGSRGNWSAGPWGGDGVVSDGQLFEDGPPWSEDEDLHSPVVVVSSRHRKHKSSIGLGEGQGKAKGGQGDEGGGRFSMPRLGEYESGRGYYAGMNRDGSETYYHHQEDETADGPGGEYITYPPDQSRSGLQPYDMAGQRDSHFAAKLPNRSYVNPSGESFDPDEESSTSSPKLHRDDESRYSRDYQFTIASPDEEMHGKAVALFDFQRENENELPLVEGQIIWVSYRHGQGWLVAEDPKTQESGLVPEEYVRLLRDIRGGLGVLNGESADALLSPQSASSDFAIPSQHEQSGHGYQSSNGSNSYQHPPVVSTFSTSSKDLHPYPQHLLGTQYGQTPPQVVHYHGQRGGSQTATPTATPLAEKLGSDEPANPQIIEEEANGETQGAEKGKAADREGEPEGIVR
ncbi:MAG: HOG (high osmolarity glycerol) pathway protein [Trichoglossum hirsutum]|nr:MAG: HOG (high osmolarity glycerol) pathway protein [Trichoglossum hirsutum]